jgi:hypothetical protein
MSDDLGIKVPAQYGGEGIAFAMGVLATLSIVAVFTNPSDPAWHFLFPAILPLIVFWVEYFASRSYRRDLFIELHKRGIIKKQEMVEEKVLWADSGKEIQDV